MLVNVIHLIPQYYICDIFKLREHPYSSQMNIGNTYYQESSVPLLYSNIQSEPVGNYVKHSNGCKLQLLVWGKVKI